MNEDKKVGVLETLENGKTVKSSVRVGYFIMIALTVFYVVYAVFAYYSTINNLIVLVKADTELKSVLLQITQFLKVIDLPLLAMLMLSWIAPKTLAKIEERKLK